MRRQEASKWSKKKERKVSKFFYTRYMIKNARSYENGCFKKREKKVKYPLDRFRSCDLRVVIHNHVQAYPSPLPKQ